MFSQHTRTFLVVFLTVFLGGLGVASAAALWSQQANVVAQVTTGTWGRQASWSWDADLKLYSVGFHCHGAWDDREWWDRGRDDRDRDDDDWHERRWNDRERDDWDWDDRKDSDRWNRNCDRYVVFTWDQPEKRGSSLDYTVEVSGPTSFWGSGTSTTRHRWGAFEVPRTGKNATYTVTVTATVDEVPSEPATRQFTVSRDGDMRFTDSTQSSPTPSASATATPSSAPAPSPTPTPTSTAAPTTTPTTTPTPSPTKTPSPTNSPWDWQLQVVDGDKVTGQGVFSLTWNRPAGADVVVKVDGAQVKTASGTQATVTLDRGPGCYDLKIYAATSSGPSQITEKVVTYHPGGGNRGTIYLDDRCRL